MKTILFGISLFLFPILTWGKPLTLGVIADLNGTECQTKYPSNSIQAFGQMLGNHEIDHIISTGDVVHGECLSYRGSTPYQNVVRGMWEEFDKQFYQRGLAEEGVAPIVAPGNHDAPYISSSSRETFKAENAEFVRHWQSLKPHLAVESAQVEGVSDNYPYYWAYYHGNVLFMVLQSTRTQTLSNAQAQKAWLRALLNTPRAKEARARIAFGHVPPYAVLDASVGSKAKAILTNEQVGKAGSLMDQLLDQGVDLLVVGHSHAPYPAELTRNSDGASMKVLSMPCGHAPRKLYSKSAAAPRGYAIVELSESNEISMRIHNWSDGKQIENSYFPASIPQGSKVSYKRASSLKK